MTSDELLRLLLTYRELEDVRTHLSSESRSRLEPVVTLIEDLRATALDRFPNVYAQTVQALQLEPETQRLCFYGYFVGMELSRACSPDIRSDMLAAVMPQDDPDSRALIAVFCGAADWYDGLHDRAMRSLHSVLSEICSREPTSLVQHLEATARHFLGKACQTTGDFASAQRHLTEAKSISDKWEFFSRRGHQSSLATLYWESGQCRRALELHSDETLREDAHRENDIPFLMRSHLSAGKCAIDLRVPAKAGYELGRAKDLVDAYEGHYPVGEGTLILYSAELDTLWGNVDEGIHLFEYAIEVFERMTPPFHPGILEAKIGLIQFALREGLIEDAFRRIGELLEEAEEKGCLAARTRLLAYQARLLLNRGTPLRLLQQGYDDFVHRAHLMNNPYLTFLAYTDCYMFAREQLSRRDQKFWLQRLRGLRKVLDQSCFEDLYREYILEIYRKEIEGGLDRLDSEVDDFGQESL